MTRCWCGFEGAHEHMCGAGFGGGFHVGYLLPLWQLIIGFWQHMARRQQT
jgi:hypothetical protein